jgi:hypothetical protein
MWTSLDDYFKVTRCERRVATWKKQLHLRRKSENGVRGMTKNNDNGDDDGGAVQRQFLLRFLITIFFHSVVRFLLPVNPWWPTSQ